MRVPNLFSDFLSLFYPNYCYGCQSALVKGEDMLCSRCILELPKTNYHHQNLNPLKERLLGRLHLQHAVAFLKFRKHGIVQHLLHELKYHNHPEVGVKLGKLFGKELKENNIDAFDLIVPIPLHPSRLRQRGYNQSAKFAEGLSESLGVSWNDNISIRTVKTSTQTKKGKRARWQNVKDVFALD